MNRGGAASPSASPPLPPADALALLGTSWAMLALLWAPIALMRQLDAFVAFLTPLELLRDLALAVWLLGLPAALLTGLALFVDLVVVRLNGRRGGAGLRWTLLLLPTLWLVLWQFGGAAWAWLRAVAGPGLAIGPQARVAVAMLLLALIALLIWKRRLGPLLARLVPTLASLRPALWLALPLAALALLVAPPRLLRDAPAAPPLAARDDRPDIYLITIDTLAADDAQVCGDGPTLMPRLRALAQRSSCFSRHYSNGNFTTPGTSTLETGRLPWHHWGVQIVAKIAGARHSHHLAEQLRQSGYETSSVSANILASPRHHGTHEGYTSQRIESSSAIGDRPRIALTWFPDTTLPYWLSAIVPFLDTLDVYRHGETHPHDPARVYAHLPRLWQHAEASRRPQFFWLHTLPPHDPYLPPPETRHKLLPAGELERWSQQRGMGVYAPAEQALVDKHRRRYGESIMGADLALGRLLDELERSGRLDRALIVVTSDHGESFERGFMGHAGDFVHDAVLRVPLVVKIPGQREARHVDAPVSLVDLAPTLLDYAGAPALPVADGRSLRPALEGAALAPRPAFSMAMEQQSRFAPIRRGHYAIVDGPHKLILHLAEDRIELYDVVADPFERTDLAARQPEVAQRLKAALLDEIGRAERQRGELFEARR